jgi:putative ABC transport system permease protein
MDLQEIFNSSIRALYVNRGRTFLTMLGVIIGVFSVVSLVSLVRGVQNYVTDQFDELGSNLVYVFPGSGGLAGDPAVAFSNNKLSEKHIKLIKTQAPDSYTSITPYTTLSKPTTYKTKSFLGTVVGADYVYEDVFKIKLESGDFYSQIDDRSESRIAVIGHDVNEALFKNTNAVGKRIKLDTTTFKVLGVMEKKGPDFDPSIIIPHTTLEKIFDVENYSYITITLKDSDNLDYDMKAVEVALLADLAPDEFTLYSQEELLSTIQEILGVLTISLGAVAGISLLVGGIGIMNIMLVSVTERIREIGLRKALGATPSAITMQFLIESVLISLSGGVIGLGFGGVATLIAQKWVRAEITMWSLLLAFGFSILVGITFGTYPAVKAGKKDPIDALRYE